MERQIVVNHCGCRINDAPSPAQTSCLNGPESDFYGHYAAATNMIIVITTERGAGLLDAVSNENGMLDKLKARVERTLKLSARSLVLVNNHNLESYHKTVSAVLFRVKF